jgi:hypothetical protein
MLIEESFDVQLFHKITSVVSVADPNFSIPDPNFSIPDLNFSIPDPGQLKKIPDLIKEFVRNF